MLSRLFKILVPLALAVLWQMAWAGNGARNLLVVGDSLSAGYGIDLEDTWVSLLQDRLAEQGYGYRVINASISGDTTGSGLQRLPRALQLHQPDIVLIELGGNDGLRGTPVFVAKRNLAAMIELSQDSGARVILAGMQMPPNYGIAYAREFAAMYPALADEYGVSLIGFFLEGVALDPTLMQQDNIHPNASAQPLLLENVWTILAPQVLERDTGSLTGAGDATAS